MRIAGLAVLSLLVLAACAAPPEAPALSPPRPVDKPFDAVWTAALDALAELNLRPTKADKSAGQITTDWLPTDTRNCDCGTFSVDNFRMNHFVKVSLSVARESETSSTIRVGCRFRLVAVSQSHSKTTSCDSTGRLEKEILDRLFGRMR